MDLGKESLSKQQLNVGCLLYCNFDKDTVYCTVVLCRCLHVACIHESLLEYCTVVVYCK